MKQLCKVLTVLAVVGGVLLLAAALWQRCKQKEKTAYVTLYNSGVEF